MTLPPGSPRPVPPTIATAAPRCTKLFTHSLQYKADRHVGFGATSLYLGVWFTNKMVKFDINDGMRQVWEKRLPEGVKYDCNKHVTDSMLACRNRDNDPTVMLDGDLRHISSHTGDYGDLRAALPGGRLLYVRKISEDNYSVSIYQLPQHKLVTTLSRPGQPYRWYGISACCDPHSQWLAVTDATSRTLDIYNHQYQHQSHIQVGTISYKWSSMCEGLHCGCGLV